MDSSETKGMRLGPEPTLHIVVPKVRKLRLHHLWPHELKRLARRERAPDKTQCR